VETLSQRRILVLGASGLIGHNLAVDLAGRGHQVLAAARHFTPAQKTALSQHVEVPVVDVDAAALAEMIAGHACDIVINCIGVLQDGPGGRTRDVHQAFVERLLAALRRVARPVLLIHLSVPGEPQGDATAFSRTKRQADHLIAASGLPHAILRPGFVVAPAAFGGSAMIRALAASPFDLPDAERQQDLQAIGIAEVMQTAAHLATTWRRDAPWVSVVWDLMHPDRTRLGDVLDAHRGWLGASPRLRVRIPRSLLDIGAKAGDLASRLGWRPPIRSTALAELRRGVTGDPDAWLNATGIVPRPLGVVLHDLPATVQERWFARLHLLKPVIVLSLVVFWAASGLIALTVAFGAAVQILTSHGFPTPLAQAVTVASSLVDITVGLLIAHRRTCRMGLLAGIAVSIGYMAGAALITPDLWLEPLGALVKTGPAVVLMLVALAVLDER
jgi:uncharacterized protein YbjT (DUF2867 family)